MSMKLDPRLVFDRFVVGPSNGLAVGAARRVSESLGRSYNPLVICGPPGVGKTHLLNAIGQHAQYYEPDLRVRYDQLGAFVERLTASITDRNVDRFRAASGGVDLLLLDDFQEVAGKERTQTELLRLFNEMVERGGQVVVAADRSPHEIPALDQNLIARLESGLIVEVETPEADTRLNILFQALRDRGATLPTDALESLARLRIESVRELHASLDRILEAVEAEREEPSPAWVARVLGIEPGTGEEPALRRDEFGDFLTDISTAVAAVVETAPWRRALAEAILRWEGEGVRTRRLEEALDADSAPDVDALLDAFARDVARLREVRLELKEPPADPAVLSDPDRVAEAEALLARQREAAGRAPAPRPRPARGERRAPAAVDSFFLDREKLAWNWLALEERLVEELG